jgi:polar amino acid transport system permease protein
MPGRPWTPEPPAEARGWRARVARIDPAWALPAAAAAVALFLVLVQPDPYRRIVIFLGDGLVVTVSITVVSFACILVVGLLAGLGRVSQRRWVRAAATGYVELVRGVPVLVQLLFIYYALPVVLQGAGRFLQSRVGSIGGLSEWLAQLTIQPFLGAVVGLTICYGAYVGEVYRAGIEAVPRGQMEAARSLGLSYAQAMRYVVLPQAFRMILPTLGNELIALLKDSSLVSVVAVADMTRRGREFMSKEFDPLETWLMVGLLYLVLTLIGSRLVAQVERRTAHGR